VKFTEGSCQLLKEVFTAANKIFVHSTMLGVTEDKTDMRGTTLYTKICVNYTATKTKKDR